MGKTYELRPMAEDGWVAIVQRMADGSERQIDFMTEAEATARYGSRFPGRDEELTGEAWPGKSGDEP